MGIRFECVHCGHILHVKNFLAGKRGLCPHCQGRIDIPHSTDPQVIAEDSGAIAVEMRDAVDAPLTSSGIVTESVSGPTVPGGVPTQTPQPAAGDPIAESPQLHWYVLPAGSMTKYGPAQGELMRAWLSEGRIAADSLVWREGWPQWRTAASAFPQLTAKPEIVAEAGIVAGGDFLDRPTPVVLEPVRVRGAAVVVSLDEPAALAPRGAARRTPAKAARQHQALLVGLIVGFAVLVPVLIYVLAQQ